MNNIALAFSGGGFRAACFSLGSLSYLNHIKYKNEALLKNVKFISSTSGGSITNLVYSSFLFRGKSFSECYNYLLEELSGEKLLARAIKILVTGKPWKDRPDKSRNLINAFSLAYDELLTEATFGLYSDRIKNPHLEEICVNATEFTNGLPFRFQSQHPDASFPKGKVGSNYIFFDNSGLKLSGLLKLADLLASSSCFPSGFEPMIFPNDYSYKDLSVDQLRGAISYKANVFTLPSDKNPASVAIVDNKEDDVDGVEIAEDKYNTYDLMEDETFKEKIHFGIMDGGVTDNQAIDGVKKADDRRRRNHKETFDLVMACDVSSYFMDGYTLPLEKKKWYGNISINGVIILWSVAALILPVFMLLYKEPWRPWMYVVGTLLGLFTLPLVIQIIKKLIGFFSKKKEESSWAVIFKKYKKYFFRLRISAVKQMILTRVKSVFILANDIYLKQIRRMYYDALYADPEYCDRIIQNAIYDLSKAKFPPGGPSKPLQPSTVMIAVAEKARTMGTTLWFDKKHEDSNMKECIIATGHFTTCYSLLKHITEKKESPTGEVGQLQKELEADWQRFIGAPDEESLLKECL